MYLFTNKPKKEEGYILSLIQGIILKLSNRQTSEFSFRQFIQEKSNDDHNQEFWDKVGKLVQHSFLNEAIIHEFQVEDTEKLANWFQNSLENDVRKDFAANYTSISAIELLKSVYFAEEHDNIIDPFCGSGRLITEY